MAINDKRNVLERVHLFNPLILDLGCGPRKRNPEAIGIDFLDYPCVDIVGDVFEVLALLPPHCVDSIQSHHFIEHVPDLAAFMEVIGRIVKPGGMATLVAPHFSNPYFYSDPTHKSFFGLYTFCYYCGRSPFSRAVPTYEFSCEFDIVSVDLVFKSARTFIGRYVIKSILGKLINSSIYFKEFYEENLSYLFPCYEVRYQLRRHGIST